MNATQLPARDRVLAALVEHPGSTSKQLAGFALVGGSTASKALTALETERRAVRGDGVADPAGPSRKVAAVWHPTEAGLMAPTPDEETLPKLDTQPCTPGDEEAALDELVMVMSRRAEAAEVAEVAEDDEPASVVRLVSGGLRGLVEHWLDDHPEQEITPSKLGKKLGRSAGAISKALDKLVEIGSAVRTSAKPRTYKAAPE